MKKKSTVWAWIEKHKVASGLFATVFVGLVTFATTAWPKGKTPSNLNTNTKTNSQSVTVAPPPSASGDTSKPGVVIHQEQNENSKNNITDNSTNAPVDRSIHKHYNAAPQRHVNNADIKKLKTIPKDMKVILCLINGDQNPETIKYKEEIRSKLLEMGYNVHPSTSRWNGGLPEGSRIEVGPDEFAGWYMVKVYTR